MPATKIILVLIPLLFLLLSFTGCPLFKEGPPVPNAPRIKVLYNGEPVTEGVVFVGFGDSGKTTEELIVLRENKPCIEVSWKCNDDEIDYKTSNVIFTDTYTTSSYDYATFFFGQSLISGTCTRRKQYLC